MQKITLKSWVVLLTIVPTTVICFLIGGYFSYSRYAELDEFLALRSESIIQPLAISSADFIKNKQRNQLRHLINFAHRSQSDIVKNITIFSPKHEVIATSVYSNDINQLRLAPEQAIPENLSQTHSHNYVIFRCPIVDEARSPTDDDHINLGYIALRIDKSKVAFHQQSQVLITFAIALLGTIISALLTIILIRRVTGPISAMVQTIERIQDGKLDCRVEGELIGDLERLKNGVNTLAKSLADSQDEIQSSIDQATVDLRESLEQFEIQNVELNISKRKAQEANRVKSEFLANMSHELRTPLNGVIGFTRQVLKTPLSSVQREYLQTIENSSTNLLSIINDILDFSKLDAGKMIIEKVPFSLRETLEQALTLLAPSAYQKNIELSVRFKPQLPDYFIGDAMRIKQIITNLTNNAIKFTEQGAVSLDIECSHIENRLATLKVTITDTGIGMNKAQQKTIFEAFGQADKSITRLYGGTGLGLVISKRLAKEMQGEMGFTSEENIGSTFWFTCQCELNTISVEDQQNLAPLQDKRVLYFEERQHSRIATSEIMTSWGMQVIEASSLPQLASLIESPQGYDYALISHDVSPSGLDTLKTLISALKANIATIHLALNSNSPNLQETLINCGATSCITKPVTPNLLAKTLLPTSVATEQLASAQIKKLPLKVLAVDDNEANLTLIKVLLLEQVNEVVTAVNGLEAVELCKNEKFAIIFMDIQMPIMDGVNALKHIKADTFNNATPIIAVTAHALSEEKNKLLEQGFNSYMTKPINESMLRHTIYEYCDLANLPRGAISQAALPSATPPAQLNHEQTQQPTGSATNAPANGVIDWSLALERAGNKEALAIDMLKGLSDSLPETKTAIESAIASQDSEQLKSHIHKLNGACCYSGVPNLAQITQLIETDLKKGATIDDLEPEFFEFFEHLDNVIEQAPKQLTQF